MLRKKERCGYQRESLTAPGFLSCLLDFSLLNDLKKKKKVTGRSWLKGNGWNHSRVRRSSGTLGVEVRLAERRCRRQAIVYRTWSAGGWQLRLKKQRMKRRERTRGLRKTQQPFNRDGSKETRETGRGLPGSAVYWSGCDSLMNAPLHGPNGKTPKSLLKLLVIIVTADSTALFKHFFRHVIYCL